MEGKTSMIVVVDLDTRKSTPLTGAYFLSEPTWSPTGNYIYFSANLASGFNLWRMPLTADVKRAGPFEPVTFGIGRDLHPALNADGSQLFYSIVSWNSDLWALPMDCVNGKRAGEPFPVIESSREDTRGDWSADGRKIVFTSDRGGQMNLYVASFDPEKRLAGNAVQITSGPGGDYQANWSPRGNQIAFFSRRSGNEDIWLVNLSPDGTPAGPPRQLTTDRAADINPVFSPDGSKIAFMSDRSGKNLPYVMNADGTGQRAIATLSTGGHYLRWLDANTVIFPLGGGFYMKGFLDGKDPQAVSPVRTGINSSHLTLSPDHRFFADNNHVSLQLWDSQTGHAQPDLFTFPDKNVGVDYTVWSPDGRFILFDRNNPQGGDIYEIRGLE
jgi:Tol biopolymer transport system component